MNNCINKRKTNNWKAFLALLVLASSILISGCSKKEKTITGALIGAGAGAAIGSAAGNTGGAVVGGALGGVAGGLIGHSLGDDGNKNKK